MTNFGAQDHEILSLSIHWMAVLILERWMQRVIKGLNESSGSGK